MVIVTGATGHIGNVLVHELLRRGERVRILALGTEASVLFRGLPRVEIVHGDVTKPETLERAFHGVETVYHLAGIVRITPGKKNLLYEVNVEGTKNVVNACLKAGVERLVYTSSVHAFVEPPKGVEIDESALINPDLVEGEYARTKAMATLAVLDAVRNHDLNAVVVCPTGVIGPYDHKISQMGQVILDFIHGRLKAYISGAYNFVDVRDVSHGLISAAEHGRKGEVYLFAGRQIRIAELLEMLSSITHKPVPKTRLPSWVAIAVSPFSNAYYRILKQKPLFTKYSVQTLASNCCVSNEKARRELGFTVRPTEDSIADSVMWFIENGKV